MFTPSREDARRFYCEAWERHRSGGVLSPLESMAVDIILMHPEYHTVLEDAGQSRADYTVEGGQTNPFLHLSLHMAVNEQLSIDQPPGIRAAWQRLCATRSEHDAAHVLMEALAETIWEVQRLHKPYSSDAYLERIHHHLGRA